MITLQDLGLAYRKAKVDLYYSSHAFIDALADYMEKLLENLSSLLAKSNREIDVQDLRRFQSSHRSANRPFKHVPDGFEIDFYRRLLPVEVKL